MKLTIMVSMMSIEQPPLFLYRLTFLTKMLQCANQSLKAGNELKVKIVISMVMMLVLIISERLLLVQNDGDDELD